MSPRMARNTKHHQRYVSQGMTKNDKNYKTVRVLNNMTENYDNTPEIQMLQNLKCFKKYFLNYLKYPYVSRNGKEYATPPAPCKTRD